MIRIAIVEDDAGYRKQLQEYLHRYGQESGEKFTLKTFTDGDEIAIGYKPEYDIILMDIQMNYMDGMTAAEEIRRVDSEVVIIFITNSQQYAIKGYAVDALDYVLKPISYYAFSQRIDRAITRLQNRTKRFLYINSKEGGRKLDCSRLMFVEVQGHDLYYHTMDGIVTGTGTMKEVEESLDSRSFFRCNNCYLVNLDKVDGIRGTEAIVGSNTVQISRARKKAFMDALNNYINEVAK